MTTTQNKIITESNWDPTPERWVPWGNAPLAFVRRIHRSPVNFPQKGPVTRKCFHLMTSSWLLPVSIGTSSCLHHGFNNCEIEPKEKFACGIHTDEIEPKRKAAYAYLAPWNPTLWLWGSTNIQTKIFQLERHRMKINENVVDTQ